MLLTAAPLMAQQPITPTEQPKDGQPYTLRIYPTLFQVPTLVVYDGFPEDENKHPLTPKDFSITLDDGPVFNPEEIRLEGADPIQLIILADFSGDQNRLLKDFGSALALAATSLRPQDRVSLYAMDCSLVTSMRDLPPDPATLQDRFASLLASPSVHGPKGKSACRNSLHLWDDTAFLSRQFQNTPSRRVLLIVSEGRDARSKITAEKARDFITFAGISVFGMRDSLAHGATREMEANLASHGLPRYQDELFTLVASEGGTIYETTGPQLAQSLPKFIDDLRNRYILEFMGPSGGGPGMHQIDIKVDRDSTSARSAPITAALPDPVALAADPTVIPSGSKTATFGTHRPKQ